jgi:hypothetical protein
MRRGDRPCASEALLFGELPALSAPPGRALCFNRPWTKEETGAGEAASLGLARKSDEGVGCCGASGDACGDLPAAFDASGDDRCPRLFATRASRADTGAATLVVACGEGVADVCVAAADGRVVADVCFAAADGRKDVIFGVPLASCGDRRALRGFSKVGEACSFFTVAPACFFHSKDDLASDATLGLGLGLGWADVGEAEAEARCWPAASASGCRVGDWTQVPPAAGLPFLAADCLGERGAVGDDAAGDWDDPTPDVLWRFRRGECRLGPGGVAVCSSFWTAVAEGDSCNVSEWAALLCTDACRLRVARTGAP